MTSWIIKVGVGLIRAWFGLSGRKSRKLRHKQFEKLRPQSAAVHSVFLSQLHSCRTDNAASIYPRPLLYFTIQCIFIWCTCYERVEIWIYPIFLCGCMHEYVNYCLEPIFWVLLGIVFHRTWVSGVSYLLFVLCFSVETFCSSSVNMENMQSSSQTLSRVERLVKATAAHWDKAFCDACNWYIWCKEKTKRSLLIVMHHHWTGGICAKQFQTWIIYHVRKAAHTLWAAFLFENMHACSIIVLRSSLQTPQLQPTDTLKVKDVLRNAPPGQLPSITTQHHQLQVPHRKSSGLGVKIISMCAGQTRREEEAEKSGDNMWHHSESRALRRSTFVARSQPDVPSVSKQEWLREGNFQQFVRF